MKWRIFLYTFAGPVFHIGKRIKLPGIPTGYAGFPLRGTKAYGINFPLTKNYGFQFGIYRIIAGKELWDYMDK
jgi:hypothetical protein